MKPGLAVLPLEVWADVFVFPWITRRKLAKIVDKFKNRKFAEKLQFRLHDMGKLTLRYLQISAKPLDMPNKNPSKYQFWKRKIPQYRASLAVANGDGYQLRGGILYPIKYKECKFPETEMPENIKAFKQLKIGHLDDQVLDFLAKIKPLFTNVVLNIVLVEYPKNLCILMGHLLPMVGSIRQINCSNYYMQMLERRVPGTLERAKELDLGLIENEDIPTYLDWLSAPLDFDLNGPRFLKIDAYSDTIIALVDAIRKDFLASNAPSTFVILINHSEQHPKHNIEEFNLDNATTKEKLTVRNAQFNKSKYGNIVHYVEIMRHPADAGDKMRDWIEKRAFYEERYNKNNEDDDGKQVISINTWPLLTIGQITKEADGMDQGEDNKSDGNNAAAGPSSSSAKKTCVIS